jgi:hypothetical protein
MEGQQTDPISERNAIRRAGQLEAARHRRIIAAEMGVRPSQLFEAKLERYWARVKDPTYYDGPRATHPQSTLRCNAETSRYPTRGTARQPGAE